MEYMLTFHILNVYVDKTQPHQFKFTFKKNYSNIIIIIKLYLYTDKSGTAAPFTGVYTH